MRRLFILTVFLSVAIGCNRSDKVPKGILSAEKMESVLWDLANAESWARQTSNRDSTVEYSDEIKVLSNRAFQLNDVTEDEFHKSYDWYTRHSDVFLTVIDSLETRIKREDSLKSELMLRKMDKPEPIAEEKEVEDSSTLRRWWNRLGKKSTRKDTIPSGKGDTRPGQ